MPPWRNAANRLPSANRRSSRSSNGWHLSLTTCRLGSLLLGFFDSLLARRFLGSLLLGQLAQAVGFVRNGLRAAGVGHGQQHVQAQRASQRAQHAVAPQGVRGVGLFEPHEAPVGQAVAGDVAGLQRQGALQEGERIRTAGGVCLGQVQVSVLQSWSQYADVGACFSEEIG